MSMCSLVCTNCGSKSFVIVDGTAAISATGHIVKVDNSIQQLKAEIATLEPMLLESITSGNFKIVSRVHDRIRQLLAV
jgi:hypothetical protein